MTRKQALRIGVYVTLGVIVSLVLLHPFTRQAIFGPKIRDLPLCYWQDGFRRGEHRNANRDSLTTKVVRWLGLDSREDFVDLPEGDDGLRVLLSLVDDPEPHVREKVAFTLGRCARDDCVQALLRLLDDPEAKVRAAAASSLGSMQPEVVAALPRLVELLEDDNVDCRVQAAGAVWLLGHKKYGQVVPILRQALKDPNAMTRLEAVHVVGRMGKDAADALPEIGVCATEDPHPGVQQDAFRLLARFGRPAIPFLVKALHDTHMPTVNNALITLFEFGPDAKEAVPALQALLRHSSFGIRDNALGVLQRIDPEQYPAPKAEPE
jgi:HEAT repeat protein